MTVVAIAKPHYNLSEQMETYRRNFAPKSSNEEWGLFVQTCLAYGLNPLRREIYLVSRWDKDSKGYKASAQVSIGGLIKMADNTRKFQGLTRPIYYDEDGGKHDVWLTKKTGKPYPYAVEIGVYRAGFVEPLRTICYFHEICQTTKDDKLTRFWDRMGITMLEKCGAAKGLRLTFSELSGIYIDEEMEVANLEAARINITPQHVETTIEEVAEENKPELPPVALNSIPNASQLKEMATSLRLRNPDKSIMSWDDVVLSCLQQDIDSGQITIEQLLERDLTPDECERIHKKLEAVKARRIQKS